MKRVWIAGVGFEGRPFHSGSRNRKRLRRGVPAYSAGPDGRLSSQKHRNSLKLFEKRTRCHIMRAILLKADCMEPSEHCMDLKFFLKGFFRRPLDLVLDAGGKEKP